MNVREIVKKHLDEVNAEGLCSSNGIPCGCSASDLMYCMKWASEIAECVPARRVPCTHEQCNHYLRGPCEATAETEWCYVPLNASLATVATALAKAAKLINERYVIPICPQEWDWEPERGCGKCQQDPAQSVKCWLAWLMDPKTEAC